MSRSHRDVTVGDVSLMKLASELTRLSALDDLSASRIDFGDNQSRMISCLIDNSVLSWWLSGAGNDNGHERRERDIVAFNNLTRLAELELLRMSIPHSVLEELSKAGFSDDKKQKLSDLFARVRMIDQTVAFEFNRTKSFVVNQEPTSDRLGCSASSPLSPCGKDPNLPRMDRPHYEMATVGRQPFVTMDYKLVSRMSRAINEQIEIIEGRIKTKDLPETWPLRRAPVVTPSMYLKQLILNNPAWEVKLDN